MVCIVRDRFVFFVSAKIILHHSETNGVQQELKLQMALPVKSGLFPIQWQCRFRTLVITFVGGLFYIHLFVPDH